MRTLADGSSGSRFFSPLGELLVEEPAELRGSLTSMPLSCWSPLSNLGSCGMETGGPVDTGAKEMGLSQALAGGAGAGTDTLEGKLPLTANTEHNTLEGKALTVGTGA